MHSEDDFPGDTPDTPDTPDTAPDAPHGPTDDGTGGGTGGGANAPALPDAPMAADATGAGPADGHPDDPGEARNTGDATPFLHDFDADDGAAAATATPAEGLEAVYDVQVRVKAVLGRSRMAVGELLQLRPGHILELDRRVGEPVDIFVNDRLIARGEVVLIDGALGVTLTEIVRTER